MLFNVPLYADGFPCKCSGNCNYSKSYIEAGKPLQLDYEKYISKGFEPISIEEKLIQKFLRTPYCLKK